MGQRCSCDEECTQAPAVGVFQKPQGSGGLVECSRPDDIKDPSAASAAKILKPARVEVDDVPAAALVQTQEICPKEVVTEVVKDVVGVSDDVFSFEASLTRDAPQGDLGMKFLREEGIPGILVVAGIREGGPAAVWNAAQTGGRVDLVIRRGDRILAVNGQPCDREPSPSLQQEGTLALGLQRWQESYHIRLRRQSADDKLGMKLELVERVDGARILRIGQVRGGLLAAWNASAAAAGRLHEVVSPGTEVLKVGALGNCPEDMMTALQDGDVDLALRRPDPRIIERSAADKDTRP